MLYSLFIPRNLNFKCFEPSLSFANLFRKLGLFSCQVMQHLAASSQQWIQDFPRGAPTPRGGGANIQFCRIFLKLHEIERIWVPGGGGAPRTPPKSATASGSIHLSNCTDEYFLDWNSRMPYFLSEPITEQYFHIVV